MNQINFLPESFRRDYERQKRRPIEVLAITLTATALVMLWLFASKPDPSLAQDSADLDRGILEIEQVRDAYDKLDTERASLQRRLMIARETYQPITVTQILARLSELTPEPVRLVHLEMAAERPTPEPAPQPEKPGANKRPIGHAPKHKEKAVEYNRMRLSLVGLAPSDDEVVTLIRRIDEDPVFTSVALRNSRLIRTPTHYAREFQLDITIELGRRFVPASQEGAGRDEN